MFGCSHGRDFVRAPDNELVPGKTTRAEILAKVGPPLTQDSQSRKLTDSPALRAAGMSTEGQFSSIGYSWSTESGAAKAGVSPLRSAHYYFWNDVLVSHTFTSSFKTDSTAFAESALSRIERGKSSERDVVALLGPPTGRAIYPAAPQPGMRLIEYYNFEWNKGEGQYYTRRLWIALDAQGVVQDYTYTNDVKAIPPPSYSGVPYYVTVPVKGK
jgi:hypothetical protein